MDIIKEINEEWINIREGKAFLESTFTQTLFNNIIQKKNFSFYEERYKADKVIFINNKADIIVGIRMTEGSYINNLEKKSTVNFKIGDELIGSTKLEEYQCSGIPGIKSVISKLWFFYQELKIEVKNWNGYITLICVTLEHAQRTNVFELSNSIAIPLEDKTTVLVEQQISLFGKIDIKNNTKEILPELSLREPVEVYPQISWRNGESFGRYKKNVISK